MTARHDENAPEHFAVARAVDPSKHKQFRRGIEQLEQEGAHRAGAHSAAGDDWDHAVEESELVVR
jgi:peptide subunit release factor RF-3